MRSCEAERVNVGKDSPCEVGRPVGQQAGWLEVLCGRLEYGKGTLNAMVPCPVEFTYHLLNCLSLFVAFGILRDWGSGEGQGLDCTTLVSFYKRKAPQRSLAWFFLVVKASPI